MEKWWPDSDMKQAVFVIILLVSLPFMLQASGNDVKSQVQIIDTLILTGDVNDTLAPEVPFSESELNLLFDSLLAPWQANGYYYASCKLDRITNNDNKISIIAKIITGPRVRIGRLLFHGLNRSDPATVSRYFPQVRSSLLTEERLDFLAEVASRIDYLYLKAPLQVNMQEGYTVADIECYFTEAGPFAVTAGGGYVPDDPIGLVWHLNLELNNLFGQGRKASLLSQRRDRGHNELSIDYSQPVFWFGPGKVGITVATRDYRNSFYEFSVNSSYRLNRWRRMSTALSLAYRSVEPVGMQYPSFSVYSVEHEIQWQTVDNTFNPSCGVELSWSLLYSCRKYNSDSVLSEGIHKSFNEARISVQVEGYQRLIGSLIGHLAIYYAGLETDETLPPISELILVGGPGTLRGCRNEQYAVVRTAIFTFEPRLRFDKGYLFCFADGAYLNNRVTNENGNVLNDEFFRWGYGVGLAIQGSTRGVKLSLGWNPDISVDQARLSIVLSSEI